MSAAARYAEMADPDRNPQFRRRWHEVEPELAGGPAPPEPYQVLDDLAQVIAADVRAHRAGGGS